MKKILLVLGIIGVMALPELAFAKDGKQLGVYVGGHLGMSALNVYDRKLSIQSNNIWSTGDKTDTVFGGGISVGYDFNPQLGIPVRIELDYTARARGDVKSGTDINGMINTYYLERKDKIGLQTMMLNAWVDIPTGTGFTPYLGGGAGFGGIDYKTRYNVGDISISGSTSKTNFAWSLGGGVAYGVTECWTVDLGYRFIDAGKIGKSYKDEDGYTWKSKAKVQSHDMMIGMRFTF